MNAVTTCVARPPEAAAPSRTLPPIVEFRSITRSFTNGEQTTQILKGVTLRIAKGEFVAITGASGSRKSTVLHIMGLLDHPSGGTYLLNGEDVGGYSDDARSAVRNRQFGFVFQNFHLLAYASALENVLLPGVYCHTPLKALQDRARFLLERVGLEDRMHHLPSQLSGGQQQRVALARALLNSPSVILADEPTGQLDSATSRSIMALFREIRAEGTTIAIVTHDPETASGADRRIVLRDGLVVDNES